MKLRDLERHLRQHGCALYREGGAHSVWHNPVQRKIASVPRHREIKEGTVCALCRQLEIPLSWQNLQPASCAYGRLVLERGSPLLLGMAAEGMRTSLSTFGERGARFAVRNVRALG